MPIRKLNHLKQSIWVDHLSREYIESGGLEKHIKCGVSGITSNPSILCQAIAHSDAYDKDIKDLVQKGKDSLDIYDELIRRDICVAASLLHFVYASTDGLDGYVSIEVDPAFANRIDATVYQGAYLHNLMDCPNIMVKVPATNAGIEAFKQLIYDGINVNVTLLFSVDQYEKVALAYVEALEARKADGRRLDKIASVASFFISRIDMSVHNKFGCLGDCEEKEKKLWGKAGIASAKLAYEKWYELFHSTKFVKLRKEGARPQRLLWASTSNKYPDEDPLKYVTGLVAAETINTLPLKTLDAIIECKDPLTDALQRYSSFDAQGCFDELKGLRIDMREHTDQLLSDGILLFAESFDELMSCLYYRILDERGEYASGNSKFRPGLV